MLCKKERTTRETKAVPLEKYTALNTSAKRQASKSVRAARRDETHFLKCISL